MWRKCSGEDGRTIGIAGDGWERGTKLEEEVSIGWGAFIQALEGAILELGGRTAFASLSDSSCITTLLSLGICTFLIISSDAFPAFSGVILRGFSFFI